MNKAFKKRIRADFKKQRDEIEKQYGVRYVLRVPKQLPPGRIFVHNHIRLPLAYYGKCSGRLGGNGFRAWTEDAANPKNRPVCNCSLAPHLGQHYRSK
jgi:hypothetical protein